MAGIVINSKEQALSNEPFLYGKTEEYGGAYIDFRDVFERCANNIFFSEVTTRRILNLEIEKKINDYHIQDEDELNIIISLFQGEFETGGQSRKPLIDLMLNYWIKSKNFKDRASTVLEEIEKGSVSKKYKIVSTLKNDLQVTNLRDFYRYFLIEYYKPIEMTILNRIYKTSDRIFRTDTPLVYYTRNEDIPDIKVMFVGDLFQAKIQQAVSVQI